MRFYTKVLIFFIHFFSLLFSKFKKKINFIILFIKKVLKFILMPVYLLLKFIFYTVYYTASFIRNFYRFIKIIFRTFGLSLYSFIAGLTYLPRILKLLINKYILYNISTHTYVFLFILLPLYLVGYLYLLFWGLVGVYRYGVVPLSRYMYKTLFFKSYTIFFLWPSVFFIYVKTVTVRYSKKLEDSALFYFYLLLGHWFISSWIVKYLLDEADFGEPWFDLLISILVYLEYLMYLIYNYFL